MNAPYGRVHPVFRLLHGAALDVANRTDTQLLMHEWELPKGEEIVIRYTFTQNPGYVGMAHTYRAFLQERHPWLNDRVSQPVHAMVEILGAAMTPQHILGFPVDRPFALTSYGQAADMMRTLHGFGWRNAHVMMSGAHNKSIDHVVPSGFKLISQLGRRSAFNSLLETAEGLGFTFYVEGDFVNMRGNTLLSGFNPLRDAARQANRQQVRHNGYSFVYYGALGSTAIMADPTILSAPHATDRLARNFVAEAARSGVHNIAFRAMAFNLSGDFNEDRHVSRESSMLMRRDLLSDLRGQGTGIWLNFGHAYAAPFASVVTNMPLTGQGFNITETDVPFYQIALHGLVHFAGKAINLAEDYSDHVLKTMESGASLFFCFMQAPTSDLQVTRYRRYYANEFNRWASTANTLYTQYERDIGHLYNQLIADHQILNRAGVTVTVYEDGTRVYVNMTTVEFLTDTGITIPARDYVVTR
jgi:hypothetical protein